LDFDPLLGLDPDFLLEREVRLSASAIWDLQRRYYTDNADSFSSGTVPLYATTNPFVARAYARLIAAFAEDCGDQPLTIVELGAGHGRFGFLLHQQLQGRLRVPLRYVLTDVTGHSLDTWAAHPRLAPLIAQGSVDLALFDAEQDTAIHTRGGATISPEAPCGPLVVIASYVFDSLVHDAFRIHDGRLEEGQISLVSDAPWPTLDDDDLLDRLSTLFTFSALADPAVYGEAVRDDMLAFYARNLTDRTFSFPVGAMRCLQAVERMSTQPALVLSLDKADNHLAQLQARDSLRMTMHGSSSMTVNHDALGRFVTGRGGGVLLSSARSASVDSAAFVLGASAGARLKTTFQDDIEHFSPGDYLALYMAYTPQPLAANLKLMRMAGWDPRWLGEMAASMLESLGDASDEQKTELRAGLVKADAQRFSIGALAPADPALTALRAALG